MVVITTTATAVVVATAGLVAYLGFLAAGGAALCSAV